jgi:Lipase maturation factor
MFNLLLKLLEQDPGVTRLLANTDQNDGGNDAMKTSAANAPAKYIRILLYRYKFHKPMPGEVDPPYWDRELIGRVYPRVGVATMASLQEEIRKRQSWQ